MRLIPAAPLPPAESVASWPVMVARLTAGQVVASQTFARLMVRATVDTHGGFSDASSHYVIPQAGLYRLEGKVRVADGGMPAGASIGLGIDRGEFDSASFFWGTSNPSRQGVINQRVEYFAQGETVCLFVYADHATQPTVSVTSAELTLDRIR